MRGEWPSAARARGAVRPALVMAAGLVVYGNLMAYLARYAGLALPAGWLAPNGAGALLLLWWALRRGGLTRRDLGLHGAGAFRSAGWGALAGALMALPALAAFACPLLIPGPITYGPVASMEPSQLLAQVLIELPLATALCEELAFRGVLQAHFLRRLPPVAALLATSTAFALWHLVVNFHTVSQTNVGATGLVPLALAAGLAGVFAGGVIFSALRLHTRSLAGSFLAHWVVDALMTVSLSARG